MTKKQQVCKVIEDYFKDNDYTYNVKEEDGGWNLVSGFKDAVNEKETIGIIISTYDDSIIINSIASKKLKKNKVDEIAEFLMRVNDILKRGCFVVNYDHDSEVSLRIWSSTKGRITTADINYLLNVSLGSLALVMPWINKISNGELNVRKAFAGYKEILEQ